MRVELAATLEHARAQTEALLEPVSERELVAKVPTGTPLVWQLAQVAYLEELWLLRNVKGDPPIPDRHSDVYRAFTNGNAELRSLRPAKARGYAADVRERVLDMLEDVDLEAPSPLLRNGFVFGLVMQAELEQQEAMLETIQLRASLVYPASDATPPDRAPGGPDEIHVRDGSFTLGAVDEPWAYDSELEAHDVELPSFFIDRAPVTNAQFAEFVTERGYRSRKAWSAEGWEWRSREDIEAPLYWEHGDDGWQRVRFGLREPIPGHEPVQHVSWYEAEAFAAWAGKRLPTEVEWERAAGWHDHEGKFRYPWGQSWMGFEASLDRRRFSPAPVGSYSGGVSPVGCVQMGGDVWEWTSSSFQPYPGFLAFPYPEYSEIYFGDEYRVLRGGSWATDALIARASFRRRGHPTSRHHFSGFRCARDA